MTICEGWWGDYGPADKDKSGPTPKGQSQVKKPAPEPMPAAPATGTRVVAPVIRWARKP